MAAIALAVAQVRAARVAEPPRCRRTAAVAEIVSEIAAFPRAPGSDRVATLLVGVGLTEAPLDRPVLAGAPAWAVVDSAMAAEDAAAEVAVAVAEVAEDKGTVDEGN